MYAFGALRAGYSSVLEGYVNDVCTTIPNEVQHGYHIAVDHSTKRLVYCASVHFSVGCGGKYVRNTSVTSSLSVTRRTGIYQGYSECALQRPILCAEDRTCRLTFFGPTVAGELDFLPWEASAPDGRE